MGKWSVSFIIILRWLLFLPLAFAALFLVYPLTFLLSSIFDDGFGFFSFFPKIKEYLLIIFASIYSAYSFVWIGGKVAPNNQFIVSIYLAVIYGVVTGFSFAAELFFLNKPKSDIYEIIIVIIFGGLAAIGGCLYFYEIDKKSAL